MRSSEASQAPSQSIRSGSIAGWAARVEEANFAVLDRSVNGGERTPPPPYASQANVGGSRNRGVTGNSNRNRSMNRSSRERGSGVTGSLAAPGRNGSRVSYDAETLALGEAEGLVVVEAEEEGVEEIGRGNGGVSMSMSESGSGNARGRERREERPARPTRTPPPPPPVDPVANPDWMFIPLPGSGSP